MKLKLIEGDLSAELLFFRAFFYFPARTLVIRRIFLPVVTGVRVTRTRSHETATRLDGPQLLI